MGSTSTGTPSGPSSQGYADLVDTGSIVFVAGQVGLPPGVKAAATDFRAEALTTFERIGSALASVGLGLGDVVRCTVYLTDFEDFGLMEEVFRAVFPTSPPTRTTVGVSTLARDCRIEVEATAARPRVRDD